MPIIHVRISYNSVTLKDWEGLPVEKETKMKDFSNDISFSCLSSNFWEADFKLTGWEFKEYGMTLRQVLELEDYIKKLSLVTDDRKARVDLGNVYVKAVTCNDAMSVRLAMSKSAPNDSTELSSFIRGMRAYRCTWEGCKEQLSNNSKAFVVSHSSENIKGGAICNNSRRFQSSDDLHHHLIYRHNDSVMDYTGADDMTKREKGDTSEDKDYRNYLDKRNDKRYYADFKAIKDRKDLDNGMTINDYSFLLQF
ncbi:hypothetical protein RhiirA4_477924 [Rhizophagus irregularis]|uniref:Uncharacterized protein n=1 Tax=Rhizophagus irregularis TaxID=588596 RepID=A0A2I1HDX9_9GLOM|nr:hypothetical protein RhiirA4_477924 [Rhizophagus irregularis]